AAPMITPTAMSITFPRMMNVLKSWSIRVSEQGDVCGRVGSSPLPRDPQGEGPLAMCRGFDHRASPQVGKVVSGVGQEVPCPRGKAFDRAKGFAARRAWRWSP